MESSDFEERLSYIQYLIDADRDDELKSIRDSLLYSTNDEDQIILTMIEREFEEFQYVYLGKQKVKIEDLIAANDFDGIRRFVEKEKDPYVGTREASELDNLEVLKLLYAISIRKESTLESIIEWSVKHNHLENIMAFDKEIENFNNSYEYVISEEAMASAAFLGNWKIINYLLEKIENYRNKSELFENAFYGALNGQKKEVADFFFNKGISQKFLDKTLEEALRWRTMEIVPQLLKYGANPKNIKPQYAKMLQEEV